MSEATLVGYMHTALTLVLILSLPPLVIAASVGLIVGFLQAVTQIQDQTLPIAVKLIAVVVGLLLLGPLVVGPLVEHAEQVLTVFPSLTR